MVIHHLDCGTMCPRAGLQVGLVPQDPGHLVAHCLLIEGDDGLVLVDTGYGSGDVARPARIGPARHLINPVLDPAQTAVARVRALGHDLSDVRHVLVTHLDFDHAGGLGDFPQATVHVHATELAAARARKADLKLRYRPDQWAHGPRWAEHREAAGESWLGFPRVGGLGVAGVDLAMVPLPGHTTGHTGVAVRTGDRWLLHAGDLYLDHSELRGKPSRALATYHRLNSVDERVRRENLDRVRELLDGNDQGVDAFCAHDPFELEQVRVGR